MLIRPSSPRSFSDAASRSSSSITRSATSRRSNCCSRCRGHRSGRRGPGVKVVVRADSGFCREAIMAWCEADGVDYVLGLAQNTRLKGMIAAEQEQARVEFERTKEPARVFTDVQYRTLDSWSRERRVVAKAEHLAKGANPRFVVTSLTAEGRAAQPLYEQDYCGRGEMENRIKEQQLHLFADRTSARSMRGNQIRLF